MAQELERGSSSFDDGGLLGSDKPAFIPEKFKGLRKFQKEQDIQIVRGVGPGFAEVFFKGELGSPDPERNIVQVRKTGEFNPNDVAAADMLHFMGGENAETGKPLNEKFFNLKQEFIKDISPDELQFAREKFKKAQFEGKQGSNFESFDSFMQHVWSDALIRGGLFPQLMTDPRERQVFKSRKPFTARQSKILDKMDNLIKGN